MVNDLPRKYSVHVMMMLLYTQKIQETMAIAQPSPRKELKKNIIDNRLLPFASTHVLLIFKRNILSIQS